MTRSPRLVSFLLPILLTAAAGCGDDGAQDRQARQAVPGPPAGEPAAPTVQDETQGPQRERGLRRYPDAGFAVAWPTACSQLMERQNQPADPDAPGSFLQFSYTCDDPRFEGRGCAVYAMRDVRTAEGGPANPAWVVDKVEDVLREFGVRAERQRPVSWGAIEGVEVQAVRPGEPGEVWVRGLLTGPDVYILAAWNQKGGCFDDLEMQRFFASFRLLA